MLPRHSSSRCTALGCLVRARPATLAESPVSAAGPAGSLASVGPVGPGRVGAGHLDPQLRSERVREVHVERLLHGDGRDRQAPDERATLAEVVQYPAVGAPAYPRVLSRDDRVGDDDGVVGAAADTDRLAWFERERLASERDLEFAHSPASLRSPPSNIVHGSARAQITDTRAMVGHNP